jgi:hypothetical protein
MALDYPQRTTARPELEGLEHSLQPIDVVVKELRSLLGARLVAYIASVKETRAVNHWIEGTHDVRSLDTQQRLRTALQVAVLLTRRDTPEVIQAWFQGLNPKLSDRAPARLLREGSLEDDGPLVLAAARAFSAVG